MVGRNLVSVWFGIVALAGMFLLGQEGWPPQQSCADLDGDGYGNPGSPACTYPDLDCDDSDPDMNPAEEEVCDNGVDDDCDGAVDTDDTDCQPPPPPNPKVVFVTSGTYDGNLGGVAGADAICQAEAQAAGLTGIFMAWLSDSYESPDTRFSKDGTPYQLIDGTIVAIDWNDLTDGTITNPIDLHATGAPLVGDLCPWTNTLPNGIPNEGFGHPYFDSCFFWTLVKPEFTAHVGSTGHESSHWTSFSSFHCFSRLPLYCFEQ